MTEMTTGAAIVESLIAHGVDTIFGLPGAQTYGLMDALHGAKDRIRFISVRHEQAAAYMAFGYARSTGRVGAFTVVPGPGILNTMAALCTAVGCNVPVLGITGDGDMLMGLGALSTIGVQAPANLSIVILDNEVYGETGAQPSATAYGTDLTGIARASGMNTVDEITKISGVDALAARLHTSGGPLFANIKIAPGEAKRVLPSRDGAYLRSRFRKAVLGEAP